MDKTGIVYLVGAGPGDPGLLTLRGAELLKRADVVVLDALVNPELARLAPPEAEIIQRSQAIPLKQAALTRLLVKHARAGKQVVRLKGGDPYVFGRGGEEAQALADHDVPFEVVPGVSSITAVPNCAGIPLTHRDHCSSFTVVTGHGDPEDPDSKIDWKHVADEPGTKVILMGADRTSQFATALLEHGVDPETPVAMVRLGSTTEQKSLSGTLANIARLAAAAKMTSPVVTIIGSVVASREALNWFEQRPLFGRRVVVTRASDQAGPLVGRLRELGARILQVPCIRIAPPSRREPILEALAGLNSYDWIIFTSTNGVDAFFDYFFRGFKDLRDIGGVRIGAVGPATAAKLAELHLQVDVVPPTYTAAAVAQALSEFETVENLRILLPRAEVANPDLPKLLEDQGGIVDDIAFYRTVSETEEGAEDAERLAGEGADWVLFTSGSTVQNFHARFDLPELVRRYPGLKLASVGPETTKALAALSMEPNTEASPHTIEGLVTALERWETRLPTGTAGR